MITDELSKYYADFFDGSYNCVDRVVLNAYFGMGHSPAGFRFWWRQLHNGSEEELDNMHLMRMAGRFSRRVRGYAKAHSIPVIDCSSEEREHKIAEEHLKNNPPGGLFLILAGRAMAIRWEVKRSGRGVIRNLEAKQVFINHYSFHIMDAERGRITIKMPGHPPFAKQVILNGHEYVACQSQKAAIPFTKEGNCFNVIPKPSQVGKTRIGA